uniref:Uncharacterized protein n=1 Tax=Falco tinnunculus TaxID=100819 RepID=A0A8C4V369_FALTI
MALLAQTEVGLLHKASGQHTRCTENVAREVCFFAPHDCCAMSLLKCALNFRKKGVEFQGS